MSSLPFQHSTGTHFIKPFTGVTYSSSHISCRVLKTLHARLYIVDGSAYFATAIRYTCKFFMKLTRIYYELFFTKISCCAQERYNFGTKNRVNKSGACTIKPFTTVIYGFLQ
jgi:hypothetical protein